MDNIHRQDVSTARPLRAGYRAPATSREGNGAQKYVGGGLSEYENQSSSSPWKRSTFSN